MSEQKLLIKFYVNCGRMGSLDGLFICTKAERDELIGKTVRFGEVLGKHSDITVTLEEKEMEIISEDQEKIAWLLEICGTTVSGFDPRGYGDED